MSFGSGVPRRLAFSLGLTVWECRIRLSWPASARTADRVGEEKASFDIWSILGICPWIEIAQQVGSAACW